MLIHVLRIYISHLNKSAIKILNKSGTGINMLYYMKQL